MQRPESMSAVDASAAIERGSLTCEALARACLERIATREPIVHAWRELDADRMLTRARALDRAQRQGPLHGLPVAIKDIIATADFPTRYGSSIYADHRPSADAACVSLVMEQGAVIPGKTVTTEFAYFQPGPTANPKNPLHTPGGSSSGSAAAVADWMVPLALGTQTAGSVIRPAAFCGIVGFKPTYGRLNLTGVKPFAPSLDTLGCFARDVGDVELLRSALTGDSVPTLAATGGTRARRRVPGAGVEQRRSCPRSRRCSTWPSTCFVKRTFATSTCRVPTLRPMRRRSSWRSRPRIRSATNTARIAMR